MRRRPARLRRGEWLQYFERGVRIAQFAARYALDQQGERMPWHGLQDLVGLFGRERRRFAQQFHGVLQRDVYGADGFLRAAHARFPDFDSVRRE